MRRATDRHDEQADAAARDGAPAAASEPPVLRLQRSAGNAATSRAIERFEDSFGADFSSVRIHPDSPRAGGAVHAVTEGEDIHVAGGRLAPGSPAGDRLIAHELAHVVQQRGGGSGGGLIAEADADVAASAAVAGRPARPAVAAPAGAPQAYEAWEHRDLGDAMGGADRKVMLPNGIELTYGQIVALSGDFYRSPEALMHSSRSELQGILDVMAQERRDVDPHTHRPESARTNANNAEYEMATTGGTRGGPNGPAFGGDADTADPTQAHGEVREGEHVESAAPGAAAGFFDLADANAAHFSPDNIRLNWKPKHQLALDLAKRAWQERGGGSAAPMSAGTLPSAREGAAMPATSEVLTPDRPDPGATRTAPGTAVTGASPAGDREAEAWLASAFSDHYLTDAFASGHLISGDAGRRLCQTFYDAHKAGIAAACWACMLQEPTAPDPATSAAVVAGIQAFLEDQGKAPSLLLKTVHDFYNREGAMVRNALGTTWVTVGDSRLGGSPQTMEQASLASKASRDAIEDVLRTGTTDRAEAALDYIPDMAAIPGGPFVSIADFAVDPRAWDPVLARSLSGDPGVNDLYGLVKGNLGPIASLQARKAGRSIGQSIEQGVDDILSWPGRLEREIERLYSPY